MSKYIDADKLPYIYTATHQELVLALEEAPAADVQEVRHGEWVFKFYCGNMSGYDYGMTCSVCGKPTHRQFAEKMPPFCPNCGASMVNEDE